MKRAPSEDRALLFLYVLGPKGLYSLAISNHPSQILCARGWTVTTISSMGLYLLIKVRSNQHGAYGDQRKSVDNQDDHKFHALVLLFLHIAALDQTTASGVGEERGGHKVIHTDHAVRCAIAGDQMPDQFSSAVPLLLLGLPMAAEGRVVP